LIFKFHKHRLSGPTNFEEIYKAASEVVDQEVNAENLDGLTFHLSPGTPAMAAVWIILSKAKYNAELVETSREAGFRRVSIPFDIAAEFIPTYLKITDKKLEIASQAHPEASVAFENIIHRSQVMKRLIHKASKVAYRSVPTLIEGESGTGKELLARAIHNDSPRKDKPFIPVNCGAIPEELVESELFGHKKGAFTGAVGDRKGHFESANGGTIFLDEIGELPLKTQVKLLRVLQESELTPLGMSEPKKIDVRVIAATNRDLQTEIASGHFREDLFYRLAVAVLKVPPLRDRAGDLGLLIDSLLNQVNKESEGEPGFRNKKISASAKKLMLNHEWPGNVRELFNTIRRAAIWSDGETIGAEEIKESLLPTSHRKGQEVLGQPLDDGLKLPEIMAKVAKHYLERAYKETGGNKTKAADLLGLPNYQTFSNWIDKYGAQL
jgi:transcriptional regulator with PAS, ATPase and Fis domain